LRSGTFVVFVLLGGCASVQHPAPPAKGDSATPKATFEVEATGEASLMTNQALRSFRNQYLQATEHKAFAQSDSGAWSWKSNRTTREYAIMNALIDCQKQNKRHEAAYPCKILNVDGEWVGSHETDRSEGL
jgi:hypothetical protein